MIPHPERIHLHTRRGGQWRRAVLRFLSSDTTACAGIAIAAAVMVFILVVGP